MPKGIKGFQKGHEVTKEMRKHLSEISRGRILSEETKKKMKGRSPWNKGLTGEKYSDHYKEGHPKGMRGKTNKWGHHSNESKIKISAFNQRISVEEWNGFKLSFNRYLKNNTKYQTWRNLIFLRDNFICQNQNCEFCRNKVGVFLQAHHIKPLSLFPELAFDIDNGITYCKEFHLKTGLHKGMQKEC